MNRYRDWLSQATRDLERASIDIEHEYWEWACFTSQQAAEKAVKALLMYQGYSAWGHSITPMLHNVDEIDVPADLIERAQLLDTYYIPTRYPNGFSEGKPADYYNEKQAREAIDAATKIIQFCNNYIDRSE